MSSNANVYIVRPGDSADRIAARYTGDPGRWPELTSVNPQAASPGTMGQPPVFRSLKVGQTIFVPRSWGTFAGAVPPGFHEAMTPKQTGQLGDVSRLVDPVDRSQAQAGDACGAGSPITDIKPYAFKTGSDYPYQVAKNWTGNQNLWHELRRANYDDPDGFSWVVASEDDKACLWNVWGGGKAIKIPANWPDVPAIYQNDIVPVDEAFPGTYVSAKDDKGIPWYWIPVGIAAALGLAFAWGARPKADTRAQKAA